MSLKVNAFVVICFLFVLFSCRNSKSISNNSAIISELSDKDVADKQDTVSAVNPILIQMNQERENRYKYGLKHVEDKVEAFSDSLLLSWERGSCYGRCPVYNVKIYKSGYGEYESVRWTNFENGLYSFNLTQSELNNMMQGAEDINFYDLDSFYDSDVSDLPSYFVYVNNGDKVKGIRDRRLGPMELKTYVSSLDSLLFGKQLILLQLTEK